MSKGLPIGLLVVAVTATGFIIFQQRQINRWRGENEALRSQAAAAAELQAQSTAAQAKATANVMTPTSPDPELLRLRAEVARLRGVETELARTRQQISQPKAAAPAPAQPIAPAEEAAAQYSQRLTTMTVSMKQIGLALRMLGNDETVTDKSILQNGQLNPRISEALATIDNASAIDWANVELLVSNAGGLDQVDASTLLARTKPMQTPDGKWVRVYGMADGSATRIVHQTPDEVWDGASRATTTNP